MAYQNRKHNNHGWSHMHEVNEFAAYPRYRYQDRRVEIYEEPIAEVEQYSYVEARRETETDRRGTSFGNQYGTYESVDQEAGAFIQHEHRRMELAKLMSSRNGN
uniref:Uncharacterized protein LOC101498300 n=1 Tax=Cicer arietinum TaxID=3827 RepID=A0A1S2YFP1_CICAR|nr:uncharacterized protein LOC101498300 [Cicer arietinum]